MPLIAIVLWCRQTLTNQCRHTWRVSTTGERDRARRLVLMVGVVVLGLAIALGIFIQYQSRDPRPPEDVARALAIPSSDGGGLGVRHASRRRDPGRGDDRQDAGVPALGAPLDVDLEVLFTESATTH